jgi:hypothetical protein
MTGNRHSTDYVNIYSTASAVPQLTCDAYETHLRIALEKADLAEFTRCITSLHELYHKARLLCQVN